MLGKQPGSLLGDAGAVLGRRWVVFEKVSGQPFTVKEEGRGPLRRRRLSARSTLQATRDVRQPYQLQILASFSKAPGRCPSLLFLGLGRSPPQPASPRAAGASVQLSTLGRGASAPLGSGARKEHREASPPREERPSRPAASAASRRTRRCWTSPDPWRTPVAPPPLSRSRVRSGRWTRLTRSHLAGGKLRGADTRATRFHARCLEVNATEGGRTNCQARVRRREQPGAPRKACFRPAWPPLFFTSGCPGPLGARFLS